MTSTLELRPLTDEGRAGTGLTLDDLRALGPPSAPEVVRGLVDDGDVARTRKLLAACVRDEPPCTDPDGSGWTRVERFVHHRRPQLRTAVLARSAEGSLADVHAVGVRLLALRNALHGEPADAHLDRDEPGHAEIAASHYPVGAGFMVEHRDVPAAGTATILSLSRRGEHFGRGGLFVRTEDGTVVDVEDELWPGDVLLLPTRIRHGVAHVDPFAAHDPDPDRGRWSLLCPLQIPWSENEVFVR